MQLVVGCDHHHGGRNQRSDDHEGNHAHQQDLERVIVIVHDVFHRRNVEHHLHFDSAQRAEFSKVRRTVKCQEVKPQTLHEGDKERFHQLAVTDIAKAPYQERNFGKDIAFCKGFPKNLEEVLLARHGLRCSFRHSEVPFRSHDLHKSYG